MKVKAYKTEKITQGSFNLQEFLDKFVPDLSENSVLAISSKVVAICEGRFVKMEDADKDKLIASEAEFFIPKEKNRYNVSLTIKDNLLIAGAGIDESNGNGYYILLPENPQKSANFIREFLRKKFNIKNLGVVITDSRTAPLRWGVTGLCISYSGFTPLKDYIGKPDLFGRNFQFEKLNIADSLAATGVLVMGEGSEQTPLAIIEEIPLIEFQDEDPSKEELGSLKISLEEDLYSDLLKNAPWEKGFKK